MKYFSRTSLIFMLLILVSGLGLYAQPGSKEWRLGPEYKIEHVTRPSNEPGKGELEIRMSIPYDEIHFVKDKDQFKGRFDVSIMIFADKKKVIGESWIEKLVVNQFKMTNSRKKVIDLKKTYTLAPGKYRLEVMVTDLKTQNRRKQIREIDMSGLSQGSWMMGDLYIVRDSSIIQDPQAIPEAVYIGFSASGVEGTYPFSYIIKSRDEVLKHAKFNIDLVKAKHEYVFPVKTTDLNYNQYYLTLRTVVDSVVYVRDLPLRIQWGGTNALIPDLHEAIEQMRYLSFTGYFPTRQYRKILNAVGEEQKDFFTETWKKIDPTPHTENNELMNEYYYRVHIANQRFSGHRDGWRSDRGMVYIIYGEPDAIEDHVMEIDSKPYVIWYYYSVNRSFIFVDNTGFGDYQLTEPLSEY